jgi:hypothetical protein
LISHHPNWSLSACKDSKRIWNGKEFEEKYVNMAKSKKKILKGQFKREIENVNYMI